MPNMPNFGSKYTSVLRTWVGIQSLVGFGNTLQCFTDYKFLGARLYTNIPNDVNSLVGRLFGLWALLCAILRIFCAVDIYNKTIYLLTVLSFVLSVGHFTSEVFIYKSAGLNIGVMIQIILSSMSLVSMLIGYRYLDRRSDNIDEKMDFRQFSKKKKS